MFLLIVRKILNINFPRQTIQNSKYSIHQMQGGGNMVRSLYNESISVNAYSSSIGSAIHSCFHDSCSISKYATNTCCLHTYIYDTSFIQVSRSFDGKSTNIQSLN